MIKKYLVDKTYSEKIFLNLRIACALCFIGHGAFGLFGKTIWLNYFAVLGFDRELSWQIMPIVGIADILMGLVILVHPVRGIILWLVFWGMFTAALRPASGESFGEFFERAGNFGAPLALLILVVRDKGATSFFRHLKVDKELHFDQARILSMVLQIVVVSLIAGHGWLNFTGKPSLVQQYQRAGFADALQTAHLVGYFEIGAALFILIRPVRAFILFILFWKMFTELWYPHYPFFEWIERSGSYGTIFSFWLLLGWLYPAKRELGDSGIRPFLLYNKSFSKKYLN